MRCEYVLRAPALTLKGGGVLAGGLKLKRIFTENLGFEYECLKATIEGTHVRTRRSCAAFVNVSRSRVATHVDGACPVHASWFGVTTPIPARGPQAVACKI